MQNSIERIFPISLNNLTEELRLIVQPEAIDIIANSLKHFNELAGKVTLSNLDFTNHVTEIISKIQEEYSGVKLADKIKIVEKWGGFGWVLYPELSLPDIFNPPETQDEADIIIMSLICEGKIHEYLERIKLNCFVKNNLVDDIYLLYSNESYISCITITIALIERIIINYIKYYNSRNGTQSNVSSKNYKKTLFRNIHDYEERYITYLNLVNIQFLIDRLFVNKTGKDWENEPNYVLRDYIMHGASNNNWTKTDAVKVILLLIELSEFVENQQQSLLDDSITD